MMMAAAVLSLSLQAQEVKNEREDIKILHGPYLQNVTDTEATLVWISNNESIGWVELAPDDGTHFYQVERPRFFDLRNGIKAESRIHSVKLHGLQPGTTYRYRVFAKDILYHSGNRVHYGNVASTVVYQKEPLRFVTTDPSKDRVTFAMINDIHGKNDLLVNLLGQCDLSDTDMVLFVGDMASVFNSEEKVFADFMDTSVKLFASEVPMYYTRGNHETRGVKAYDFQDYFSTKSEHIYYSYRQGPVFFIALDSGEDKPDSDIEYADMNDYDGYRDEQVEWLRKVVESEEFKSAPYKIVTCHIPPFGGWHGNAEVAEKFMPVLEKAGVDIMLCGHLHKYVHQKAGEGASFPIVVNSNNTLLRCEVTSDRLSIVVTDEKGVVVDRFNLARRRP